MEVGKCNHCGKAGAKSRCSGCGTLYCQRQCQLDDWPKHKSICTHKKQDSKTTRKSNNIKTMDSDEKLLLASNERNQYVKEINSLKELNKIQSKRIATLEKQSKSDEEKKKNKKLQESLSKLKQECNTLRQKITTIQKDFSKVKTELEEVHTAYMKSKEERAEIVEMANAEIAKLQDSSAKSEETIRELIRSNSTILEDTKKTKDEKGQEITKLRNELQKLKSEGKVSESKVKAENEQLRISLSKLKTENEEILLKYKNEKSTSQNYKVEMTKLQNQLDAHRQQSVVDNVPQLQQDPVNQGSASIAGSRLPNLEVINDDSIPGLEPLDTNTNFNPEKLARSVSAPTWQNPLDSGFAAQYNHVSPTGGFHEVGQENGVGGLQQPFFPATSSNQNAFQNSSGLYSGGDHSTSNNNWMPAKLSTNDAFSSNSMQASSTNFSPFAGSNGTFDYVKEIAAVLDEDNGNSGNSNAFGNGTNFDSNLNFEDLTSSIGNSDINNFSHGLNAIGMQRSVSDSTATHPPKENGQFHHDASTVSSETGTVKSTEQDDSTCIICLERQTDVWVLPCCHRLCATCALDWQKRQAYCPVCRHPITEFQGAINRKFDDVNGIAQDAASSIHDETEHLEGQSAWIKAAGTPAKSKETPSEFQVVNRKQRKSKHISSSASQTSSSSAGVHSQPSSAPSEGNARWKTQLCRHYDLGRCQNTRRECPFAHGESDLRSPPPPEIAAALAQGRPTGSVAPPTTQTGIQPSHRVWKTQLCRHFEAGYCAKPKGTCPFAHGKDELRAMEVSPRSGVLDSDSVAETRPSMKKHPSKKSVLDMPNDEINPHSFAPKHRGPNHPRWKTQMCKHFMMGNKCFKRIEECPFAHGKEDLRVLQKPSSHTIADHLVAH